MVHAGTSDNYIHDLIDTNTPLFIHLNHCTLTFYFKLVIHPNDVIFIITCTYSRWFTTDIISLLSSALCSPIQNNFFCMTSNNEKGRTTTSTNEKQKTNQNILSLFSNPLFKFIPKRPANNAHIAVTTATSSNATS